MNLWLSLIDQGTGISLPIGTSLDGVPICELVPDCAISLRALQEIECTTWVLVIDMVQKYVLIHDISPQ